MRVKSFLSVQPSNETCECLTFCLNSYPGRYAGCIVYCLNSYLERRFCVYSLFCLCSHLTRHVNV